VYSAPIIRLPSGKTIVPDLEWDASSSSISISLPDLSFPLIIAFGLGVKLPDVKGGFHLAFPSLKFGAKGEIEDSSSESEEEEKKKGGFGFGIKGPKAPKFGFEIGRKDKGIKADVEVDKPSGKIKVFYKPSFFHLHFFLANLFYQLGLPSFSLKFPNFKLDSKWTKFLYGSADTHIEIPQGQLALHLHPSLNLNVGLSAEGLASFTAPDWKFSAAPLNLDLSSPKLFHGEGLHLLRGDDGEIGLSFDKRSSRHFFFLGKAPSGRKFSLGFKVTLSLLIPIASI
jgi:hypothetical protein